MDNVNYHKLFLDQVIADVLNGIGMIKFVCNVVLIGILVLMENVKEFLITVKPTARLMDYVNHVIKDTT